MHNKQNATISLGGNVACGSRQLTIDSVDGDVVDVTLSIKKGETVEVRDPKQKDNPWILGDPGEGTMVDSKHSVTIGHKIRVGNHRQFRILSESGGDFETMIVGPASEI